MFSLGMIKAMNAKEALDKSRSFKAPEPHITHILEKVFQLINAAVDRGEFEITNRNGIIPSLPIKTTADEKLATFRKLRELGYKTSFGVISWKDAGKKKTARKRGRNA